MFRGIGRILFGERRESLFKTVGFLRRQQNNRPLTEKDLQKVNHLVMNESILSNCDEKCLSLTLSLLVSPGNFKPVSKQAVERLCRQLEAASTQKALTLQGCNQALGSFAKLKTKKPKVDLEKFSSFFDSILNHLIHHFLPACPNRELSNLFWAARVLGLNESAFIPAIERELKSFDSCDISLICAGLIDAPDHELWTAVRQELFNRKRFADKDIGSIMCSLACAGVNDRELILHLCSVIHRTEIVTLKNVAAVVWAVGTCDFVDNKLLDKAVMILMENRDQFTDPMDIRRVSRGFAVAGKLKLIEPWILPKVLGTQGNRNIADTLLIWEFVTNGLISSALKLFRNRSISFWESQIASQQINASQLYHLYLGCLLEGNCDLSEVELRFLKSLQPQFSSINENMSSSVLHKQASDAVRKLKYEHVSEYQEPNTGYVVDIFIPTLQVAVEVQGPTHFVTHIETGALMLRAPDIFKQNVLRKVGGMRIVHATPFNFGPKVQGRNTALMKAIIEGRPTRARKGKPTDTGESD